MKSIHWLDYYEEKAEEPINDISNITIIAVILVGFVIGLLLGYYGSEIIWKIRLLK